MIAGAGRPGAQVAARVLEVMNLAAAAPGRTESGVGLSSDMPRRRAGGVTAHLYLHPMRSDRELMKMRTQHHAVRLTQRMPMRCVISLEACILSFPGVRSPSFLVCQ